MTAPPIDLLAADFYVTGARDAYRWMRRNSPVHYDETNRVWAISTYDAVREAERDAATFSSAGGSRPETGPLPWMIDMDAPDHMKRRKLVNRAFTPARVRASEPRIRAICDGIIDEVCERGECDFLHDLAAPLPLIVICDMLGFSPGDRADVLRWSDAMIGSLNGDPGGLQAAAEAFVEFGTFAHRMIDRRRADPADDLVTVLVHAEVDGDKLDDSELAYEILLLLLGGDETTRNVTCGGMEQLLVKPDQKQQLLDAPKLIPTAVEEMLRWVSPIKNMQRTLTRDIQFHGATMHAGDKALLLYESANFDEAQFDEPDRFDVARTPNDHVAFGFGAHFCLGASLARLELGAIFDRILTRLPDIELAIDDPLPRALTGISEMPVRFTPTATRR